MQKRLQNPNFGVKISYSCVGHFLIGFFFKYYSGGMKFFNIGFSLVVSVRASVLFNYEVDLEPVINRMYEAQIMTESDLLSHPPEAGLDIQSNPDLCSNAFHGITSTEVTEETFRDAWSRLVLPFTAKDCAEIFSFWISRPGWFIPDRSDLVAIRGCVSEGISALLFWPRSDETKPLTDTIVKVLKEVIPAAFSVQSQIMIEFPASVPGESNLSYFRKYMTERPSLMALLESAVSLSDPEKDILPLSRAELNFLKTPGPQVYDFLNYQWIRNALAGKGQSTPGIWMSVLQSGAPDMDRVDMEFQLGKKSVNSNLDSAVRNEFVLNKPGMGAGMQAWLLTVGALLRRFTEISSDAVTPCIPSSIEERLDLRAVTDQRQVFYHLEEDVNRIFEFYNCIVNAVAEGRISIPAAEQPDLVATLMHLVRMATSPLAYMSSLRVSSV